MVLEDLGSTNGTYLNGEPLRGPQPLHAGDRIRIGDTRILLRALSMLRIADQWHGSDLGLQRQGNEDNYFVRAPLFVVADGMGGAQSGEVASEMAVEAFGPGIPDGDSPAEGLVHIIETANQRIHERSRSETQRAGMGTTVTAAYVGENSVTVAHVGDSRCYRVRDGELERLTDDHSLVGDLVRLGKLTEEQAETHPQRSVITRALGPEPNVMVDVEEYGAKGGDLFLVCSDGLTSMVREDKLKPLLLDHTGSLEQLGHDLIAAANAAGGRDNITVVLFTLEEVDAPAARRRRRHRRLSGGRGHARVQHLHGRGRRGAAPGRQPPAGPHAALGRDGDRRRDPRQRRGRGGVPRLGHGCAVRRPPARAADRGGPRPRSARASSRAGGAGDCSRRAS